MGKPKTLVHKNERHLQEATVKVESQTSQKAQATDTTTSQANQTAYTIAGGSGIVPSFSALADLA